MGRKMTSREVAKRISLWPFYSKEVKGPLWYLVWRSPKRSIPGNPLLEGPNMEFPRKWKDALARRREIIEMMLQYDSSTEW